MCVRLSDNLPNLEAKHKYKTRHKILPGTTRHNLEIFKGKPMTAGTSLVYYLPTDGKSIFNLNVFRKPV